MSAPAHSRGFGRIGIGLVALTAVVGALACESTALAADPGFYVAGSIGESGVHFDATDFYASTHNVGYEFAAGLHPVEVVSAEVDYVGFPRAFSGINYVDTYGVGAFALGYLPIPVVQLFGKVGVLDWRTDAQEPGYSFRHTGANLAYGVGATTSFGRLGARLQYEQFDLSHTSLMNMTSIGLTWSL